MESYQVKIAKKYNYAMITPEVNHPGVAYIDSIKETGYPNIYRREVEDKMTREKTQKIGFRTTGRMKAFKPINKLSKNC